jgi:hypothetical protein
METLDALILRMNQQLEKLLAERAAITSPLDDAIDKLNEKRDVLISSDESCSQTSGTVPIDVIKALVSACTSDNCNAFARSQRVVYKANCSLSSIRSGRGVSLLHSAARFGSVNLVKQMLEAEPDLLGLLDDRGRDALLLSVLYRHLPVFQALSRSKDCSYSHQSLPFLNNCLHFIAHAGLLSFAREIFGSHRAHSTGTAPAPSEPKLHLAMTQFNKDGLTPIHIMAVRLDTDMIALASSVNPEWLDNDTAAGMNIIDVAIASDASLISPRACFLFLCSVVQLHTQALTFFLIAASNRYKYTGALAKCDGALLAQVPPPPPPPPHLTLHLLPLLFV